MVKQHFYSRVPARASMFNRTDSFDTFAVSEGVESEFIEKELAIVDELKLTPQDSAEIWKGKVEPIYCEFSTKDGRFIQSSITFMSRDFTGERSSYLTHNLIFEGEERKARLGDITHEVFNPANFLENLDSFDITSPVAIPVKDYPLATPTYNECEDISWLGADENFHAIDMKRFIYICLGAAFKKYKATYFRLPDGVHVATVLRFMNSFLQIFPAHIRAELSFATRVSDLGEFNGVRLKHMSPSCPLAPKQKGAVLDFPNNYVSGFTDEEIVKDIMPIEFFYSLINSKETRESFLQFSNHVVERAPELGYMTFQAITDLITLFKVGCGLYPEHQTLPNDDAIINLFTIYEKHRAALPDMFRITLMKCLNRYPAATMPIPQKAFAKIVKIYPSEPYGTKRIIMNVALELIHTDLMRDKLYAFIKSNYDKEEKSTKDEIVLHLTRVFYGGFLQQKLLEFFNDIFLTVDDEPRAAIMEKVLLNIRTKGIQNEVFVFFNEHFTDFSAEEKEQVYRAVVDQLDEGDLATELSLRFLNEHVGSESKDTQEQIQADLCKAIEREQKRPAHPLLFYTIRQGGWCADCLTRTMFGQWQKRKVFQEYLSIVCSGAAREVLSSYIGILSVGSLKDAEARDALSAMVKDFFAAQTNLNILDIVEADDEAHERLSGVRRAEALAVYETFADEVLVPYVAEHLDNAFAVLGRVEAMEKLDAYIDKHEIIAQSPSFELLDTYYLIVEKLQKGDAPRFIEACSALQASDERVKKIGAAVEAFVKKEGKADVRETGIDVMFVAAMSLWLREGKFGFEATYSDLLALAKQAVAQEGSLGSPDKDAEAAMTRALDMFLEYADSLYDATQDEAFHNAFCAEAFEFVAKQLARGKDTLKKTLSGLLKDPNRKSGGFSEQCARALDGKISKRAAEIRAAMPKPTKAPKAAKGGAGEADKKSSGLGKEGKGAKGGGLPKVGKGGGAKADKGAKPAKAAKGGSAKAPKQPKAPKQKGGGGASVGDTLKKIASFDLGQLFKR